MKTKLACFLSVTILLAAVPAFSGGILPPFQCDNAAVKDWAIRDSLSLYLRGVDREAKEVYERFGMQDFELVVTEAKYDNNQNLRVCEARVRGRPLWAYVKHQMSSPRSVAECLMEYPEESENGCRDLVAVANEHRTPTTAVEACQNRTVRLSVPEYQAQCDNLLAGMPLLKVVYTVTKKQYQILNVVPLET